SKERLLDAYAHQQVPFEHIVECLQPERSLSHSALFQIMLVLQNNEEGTLTLPGVDIASATRIDTGIAEFELTLEVNETANGLRLEWKYNTYLFEQSTIARMANHFELLLNAVIARPDDNVFKMEMLTVEERQKLL